MGIRRAEKLAERDLDDPKYLQDFGREDNCWTAYDLSHLLLTGITYWTNIDLLWSGRVYENSHLN